MLARMLSSVENHVSERRSDLPGRAERAVVVTAVEHRSAPIEDPVYGPSQTRGQALHPFRQGCGALRFHEHVDVIVLERVLDDSEVRTLRHLSE